MLQQLTTLRVMSDEFFQNFLSECEVGIAYIHLFEVKYKHLKMNARTLDIKSSFNYLPLMPIL